LRVAKSAGEGPSRALAAMILPRVPLIVPTRRKEPFDDPDWLFDLK
jgi:hypothetical protein